MLDTYIHVDTHTRVNDEETYIHAHRERLVGERHSKHNKELEQQRACALLLPAHACTVLTCVGDHHVDD